MKNGVPELSLQKGPFHDVLREMDGFVGLPGML